MSNDQLKKTPSADEIIEALALEMGVDESDAKAVKSTRKGPPATPEAVARPAAPPNEVKAQSGPQQAVRAQAAPVGAAPEKPSAPARPRPKAAPPAARSSDLLKKAAVGPIFSLKDPGDPPPDSPGVEDIDDDDLDVARGGKTLTHKVVRIGVILLVTVIGLGVAYSLVPAEKRQDVVPLLQGEDIQTQRRERRRQEEEQRRREWLAAQPKYGRLSAATRPGYGLVRVAGQPEFHRHPALEGTLVESRSPMAFENLDVREHQVVYITLPNFLEKRVELFPFDHPDTRWSQDQDTGQYYCELNEILEPVPELGAELLARMTPGSVIPELVGEITVTTEPPGAFVYYNNTLLADEEGNPLTTPVTFIDYPPRPDAPAVPGQMPPAEATTAGEAAAPGQPVVPMRRPVVLSSRGVPLRVEKEGYLSLASGLYSHMFTCQPVEGVAEEAPFWEKCRYTYDTGTIRLMTPEEFEPVPAAAEGTGQAAPQIAPPNPG